MKKLLLSLLLIACVKVTGQEAFSLKNKVYLLISDTRQSTNECVQHKILFVSDSSFLSVNECKGIETLGSGRYIFNKNGITLNFDNTIVLKKMDKALGYDVYTDSLIAPQVISLKTHVKKKMQNFKDGFVILAPSDGYLGTLVRLEADNRLVRLGMAKKSNIDIFEGIDFSDKYDSIIIQRGLDKFNGETALDYFDEENKLIGSLNGGYSEGKVHYAPDGKFKMFVFEGESCGAHCGTIFRTLVQLPSGKVHEMWTWKVQSLRKYDENKYAVITRSWGGGTTGGHALALTLFSVNDEEVTYHNIGPGNNDQDFDIFSPWWGSDFLKMDFNPATRKVTYSYLATPMAFEALKEYLPERNTDLADNEGLLVTGTFILEDGNVDDGLISKLKVEYRVVELE